jgi:hypothetical protein
MSVSDELSLATGSSSAIARFVAIPFKTLPPCYLGMIHASKMSAHHCFGLCIIVAREYRSTRVLDPFQIRAYFRLNLM